MRAYRDDAGARALTSVSWLTVVPSVPVPSVIQAWDLGDGESAVLAWAHSHPGSTAIIDDAAARRCADTLNIPLRGTLGLSLLAKQRGVVALARPVVEQLRAAGLYLSDEIIIQALALVGE